jgi:hypothetical protein
MPPCAPRSNIGHAIDHVLRQHLPGCQLANHVPHLLAVEWCKRNRCVMRAHAPRRPKLGSCRRDHKQRGQGATLRNPAQHIKGRWIGPLQVLENQYQRLVFGAPDYPVREGRQLPAPQFLGRHIRYAVLRQGNFEKRRQQRHVLRRIKLHLCKGAFKVDQTLLTRYFGGAKTLAPPFCDWMERRVLEKL